MAAFGFGSALLEIAERFRQRPILAYSCALFAFGLALLVRFAFNGLLPSGFPYLTFFPAVLLTAFFCGTGPGIVTAILSVIAAWFWFIPPFDSFALDLQSTIAVLFFVAILAADLFIIHVMHSALRRLAQEQGRTESLLLRQNTLFEELQHRTANNMAFIAALLSMHKRRAKGVPEVEVAFDDAVGRLHAMARIHRSLYDPTNVDLPLQRYLGDLLHDIVESSGRHDIATSVESDVPRLEVNRLITLSLLVSELVMNAMKHAYAERAGRIEVRLMRDGDNFILTHKDDGPGFPQDFDPAKSERLGFRVLTSLARSLEGELSFRNEGGAVTVLSFPAEDPRQLGSTDSPK